MRLSKFFWLPLTGAAFAANFWMEDVRHLGRSPFHPDPNYAVFRNVKDYGAVGDGVTDDTAAINAAISAGQRCNPGTCKGSTIAPATVYFPSGTYLITSSIIDLFYTQLIGNPIDRPVIKASPTFDEYTFGLIDSNPYQPGGSLAWNSTNAFYRQIRNFVLDTTALPPGFRAVGIHWPSAQATSITNCVFRLSTVPGNEHIGLFIEEGSGGLLNDLYFYGGGKAASLGNQQYTARNLQFYGADTAIFLTWDWGWTFKSLVVKNCRVGIMMDRYANSVGSVTILDSSFQDVDIGIGTTRADYGNLGANGTLVVENVNFDRVSKPVQGPVGTVLGASNMKPGSNQLFVMGHVANSVGLYSQTGYYNSSAPRNPRLLQNGKYFEYSKPLYADIPATQFMSARVHGAQGDGSTDDTAALNSLFQYAAKRGLIAYLDAGQYLVTNTVFVPPGSRIVGEALASIILATGTNFQDMKNPRPVVQVGVSGQDGRIEWSDTVISTRGPCPGAVTIEHNLFSPALPSGMWDLHTRIGGFAGSNMQLANCPAIKGDDTVNQACIAAFMSIHVTASAGGLYTENCWYWVADHDLEDQKYGRITIYAGRGLLVESRKGRVWLSASASEHHVLYQYQLSGTRDMYIGQAQTESPYFQPHPLARYPFPVVPQLDDPDFAQQCNGYSGVESCESAWGMRVSGSTGINVYGAGLYSFFDTYNDSCAASNSTRDCQDRILSVDGHSQSVRFLGLNTLGTRIMVQQNGVDRIPAVDNNSTFADTLAVYQR